MSQLVSTKNCYRDELDFLKNLIETKNEMIYEHHEGLFSLNERRTKKKFGNFNELFEIPSSESKIFGNLFCENEQEIEVRLNIWPDSQNEDCFSILFPEDLIEIIRQYGDTNSRYTCFADHKWM